MGHTATGRCVMIECKDIRGTRLPIGDRGLKVHQWLALQELHKAGGVALLLWARGDMVAAVDMDMLSKLTKNRKSLKWADVPGKFKAPFDPGSPMNIVELFYLHRV